MPNTDIQKCNCIVYARIFGKLNYIAALTVVGEIGFMENDLGRRLNDIAPGAIPPYYQNFVFSEIAYSDILETRFLIFQDATSQPIPPTSPSPIH